ncbi:MAG: ribose-5-phosphate isomerase RpiA [Pseudomonadales bacterium]|nr:ribose-5-phosphate isomerase RpiA [Pseudomonadales bacterium]
MDQQSKKEAAAQAALERVRPLLGPDAVIGVGTGSTANCFIDALIASGAPLQAAVASSEATAARLAAGGIDVIDATAAGPLRVYVDGADEAGPDLSLIKGGGGALTREKIVAAASERFVCIVDDSKCVEVLGAFPLPVEIIPMAEGHVRRCLEALGGTPTLREGFVTDNGNLILDVASLDLGNPQAMERRLNDVVGTVCNGLFALRPADELVVASDHGVEVRTRTYAMGSESISR